MLGLDMLYCMYIIQIGLDKHDVISSSEVCVYPLLFALYEVYNIEHAITCPSTTVHNEACKYK
jgi:hypothetical protein